MEDNSSSYSNVDSLLRPDSILHVRSNHAGPSVDDDSTLYEMESYRRPNSISFQKPYKRGSSMTTVQSITTEGTSFNDDMQYEEADKKLDINNGSNLKGKENQKVSEPIMELPLNITNEINIISSRIKVMQQMWDDQQEHMGRLQGELFELRNNLNTESNYCSGLGATLGNMIWSASRDEMVVTTILEMGEIPEILGIASGTLLSFVQRYKNSVPDIETNETQFVLSIMGIVSNIAALNDGRRVIRNDPEGKTLTELIARLLPLVPSGNGDALKKILLMALFNICLDEEGFCGLNENKEFLVCIMNIIDTSSPEVVILALRMLDILTSDVKDLKSYLLLRNNLPLEAIEKLSHSLDIETRQRAAKVIDNLNKARDKFNPKKSEEKIKKIGKYICRP